MGCTTYSFAVNLGCRFRAIPVGGKIKQRDGFLRPGDYDCHFRRTMRKSIHQANFPRKTIWYVDPSGENLLPVIEDAKQTIVAEGLQWFNRFGDANEVLRTLLEDPEFLEDSEIHAGTWGFGRNPSPMRYLMTGFVALSLGKTALAKGHLKRALDSNCFKDLEPKMRAALEEVSGNRATAPKPELAPD
jgi:hypothetical protein